jgi:hypothetical protein
VFDDWRFALAPKCARAPLISVERAQVSGSRRVG